MTPTFFRQLRQHFPFEGILGASGAEDKGGLFNAQRVSRTKKIAIRIFGLLPWMCGAGFFLSLFPFAQTDFTFSLPSWLAVIAGTAAVTLKGIINIIAVSGLIGYGTNWVAIRMLFKPIDKRPIWGQGLIPAQREIIIHSLARGMHVHILSQDRILQRMKEASLVRNIADMALSGTAGLLRDRVALDELSAYITAETTSYLAKESVREQLHRDIDERIQENLDSGLKKFALQTYKRVSRSDYEQAIERLIDQIPTIIAEMMQKFEGELDALAANIESQQEKVEQWLAETIGGVLFRVDIPALLRKQMEHFDERKLERMIRDATNEQLIYIQDLGAMLGMLGGLLIWQPRLMGVAFVLFAAALWALDEALFRAKKR